jgi:prevent-host-death family protein
MRKTSFASAKARLSELVDEAEHKGARIVILRHGKPAAAIVPVSVAMPKPRRPRRRSDAEIDALYAALGPGDDQSAVDDLLSHRR